jgi:hypothetical protein
MGGWSRKERKEKARHGRSNANHEAIVERERLGSKKKRPSCGTRKFGLEYRWRNAWSRRANNDWKPCWGKYETAKKRDQALDTMNRKRDCFEYRAVDFT